tara:strand:- start:34 stop:723 length:690 start_codon:yes stop_codon:yes gene_type:complete
MKNLIFSLILLIIFGCGSAQELRPVEQLGTKADTMSYALGLDIGENLKKQNIEIEYNSFITGILDAYQKSDLKLGQNEKRNAMMALQRSIREKEVESAKTNMEDADTFLKKNKIDNADVKETPSGLQYKVIKQGNGNSPSSKDKVRVHYEGRLLNGNVFDSSISRGEPAEFALDRVIKGWTEGLQLMNAGSKFEFYIHPKLGYGSRGTPTIPANSCLIFQVELIKILDS